jgi:DME family drug/metabolite transporter
MLLFMLILKKKMIPALFRKKEIYFSTMALSAYQLFFFSGVKLTGIAVGTITMLGSSTVFAGILAAILIREKPETRWYPASLLAIIGCFILIRGGGITVNPKGILFALCSGLSYSMFSVLVKKIINQYHPFMVTSTVFLFSSVLVLPVLFFYPPVWILSARGAAVAGWLGLVGTALAYILYTVGLKEINASSAVTLSLAEPATATFLGIFLIGERLTFNSVMGVFIIFAGLAYLSLPAKGSTEKTL